jgi:hypothetical protein
MTDVRYGSLATILARPADVGFASNSDRKSDLPLTANQGGKICHLVGAGTGLPSGRCPMGRVPDREQA